MASPNLLALSLWVAIIAIMPTSYLILACSDHAFSTFHNGQVHSLFVAGSGRKLLKIGDNFPGLFLVGSNKRESDLEEWDYNQNGADWTETCSTGLEQSPINIQISSAKPASSGAHIKFGTAEGLIVYNTGHSIQAEWKVLTESNTTIPTNDMWGAKAEGIDRVAIEPLQFHIHSTCEHIVNGEGCQIELHLVSVATNSTGVPIPKQCQSSPCYAVFGVKYDFSSDPLVGSEDSGIALLADNAPSKVGSDAATYVETPETFDLDALFPDDKTYINYQGSLTAPPCSEGVNWHMFTAPRRQISIAQYENLQSKLASALVTRACQTFEDERRTVNFGCQVPYGSRNNNRGIKPLNDRTIYKAEAIVMGNEPGVALNATDSSPVSQSLAPSSSSSSGNVMMHYLHPVAVAAMGGVMAALALMT